MPRLTPSRLGRVWPLGIRWQQARRLATRTKADSGVPGCSQFSPVTPCFRVTTHKSYEKQGTPGASEGHLADGGRVARGAAETAKSQFSAISVIYSVVFARRADFKVPPPLSAVLIGPNRTKKLSDHGPLWPAPGKSCDRWQQRQSGTPATRWTRTGQRTPIMTIAQGSAWPMTSGGPVTHEDHGRDAGFVSQ